MSALYAIAMALLAGAVPVTWLGPSAWRERLGSYCSAVGCLLLVIVGLAAALGSTEPVVNLGGWLGFGHSALRADGLAGIFLALTGITGAAVSLSYVRAARRTLADAALKHAAAVHRGRNRLRQRVPVLPGLGGDDRLRVPDRKRARRP